MLKEACQRKFDGETLTGDSVSCSLTEVKPMQEKRPYPRLPLLLLPFLILAFLMMSSCSLFFGSIKPVDEKSNSYGILDLSQHDPDWVRVDPRFTEDPDHTGDVDVPESGISDIVLQSKSTASIISINSACKSYGKSEKPETLQELTRELLLGISDISLHEEKDLNLQGTPALQTTLTGKIKGEPMTLQTIVVQKSRCVYDLMYVSRPDRFHDKEKDFSQFVSSLRLR